MPCAMIYVVRHGQTEENNNNIIQGQHDTLLNQRGIDQAERVAEALKGIRFDLIYSSNLKRAYDTARLIAKHHKDVSIHLAELLRERYMGELQGKPYKEIRNAASEATVESVESFTKRISDFWDGILAPELGRCFQENQGRAVNVLIVGHGAVISTMTRYLVQARGMKDERSGGSQGKGNSGKLLKFGDTSHLDVSFISFGNSDEL